VVFNRKARELLELPSGHTSVADWAAGYELHVRGENATLRTDELPLLRALEGEEIAEMEIESRWKSGERMVLSISGGPVRRADGAIEGAVVVIRDVAARVDRESRGDLESAMVANIREGIVVVRERDGVIVHTNAAWDRMLGYGTGELVGEHVSVVNAPSEQTPEERAQEIIGALERDGRWSGEIENVRKDGTRFWSSASIATFDDQRNGRLWVTVQYDISPRKAAADALRAAEERYRRLFEDGPVGIAIVGNDMRVVDANRALREITRYRREELEGKPLADLSHPDDAALDAELVAQTFRGEIPRYRVEKRYVTRDGDVLPIVLTGSVARGPDGRALFGIAVVEPLAGR